MYVMSQKLNEQGWRIGESSSFHRPDSMLVLAKKNNPMTQRWYYMCLLNIGALFARGLMKLPSSHISSYYQCVFKSNDPGAVQLEQSDKIYKSLLAGTSETGESSKRKHWVDVSDDDDIPLGTSSNKRTKHVNELQSDLPGGNDMCTTGALSSSSSSSGGIVADDGDTGVQPRVKLSDEVDSDACDEPVPQSPSHLIAQIMQKWNIKVQEHNKPGDENYYKRLIIRCPSSTCKHWGAKLCQKHRNVSQSTALAFGQLEPYAYLVAWAMFAEECESADSHIVRDPKVAETRSALQLLTR
jgi:hypothetical protein